MAKEQAPAAAEVAAPKTTQELLTLAEARVAKLRQRLTTENVLNGIEAGQEVTFRFGRNIPERTNKAGETVPARAARILSGIVKGSQDTLDAEGNVNGKVFKIESGEGFDADTYKVNARDITSVGGSDTTQDEDDTEAADIAEAEAAAAGEDPVEAREEALSEEVVSEEGDPLEQAE